MSWYKKLRKEITETIHDVQNYPFEAIPDRKITKETCEYFGVRTSFDEVNRRISAHYFPVYNQREVLTGFIKRDLNKPKKDAWSCVGDVSNDKQLLGQNKCNKSGKKVFVVEGFYDVLVGYQALYECQQVAGKYKPSIVSVTLGAGNAKENMLENANFLNNFAEIVLCFDNDKATPEQAKKGQKYGQDGVAEVALCFNNVKNVLLPRNDPSDVYLDDGPQTLYKALMFDGKPYQYDRVTYGASSLEAINTPLGNGVVIDAFPKLMDLLDSLREGELTIILAGVKSGKTSLCKLLHYYLLKQQVPVIGAYMEESIEKTRQSFITIDNNVYLPKYRKDPTILTDEQKTKTMQTILRDDLAFFVESDKGHIGPQNLIACLEYGWSRGAKIGIIDHLSYVFSGNSDGGDNERKEIDKLLTDLAAFVRRTKMHIIAVSHIKRKAPRIPTNKDGSIKYPYWVEIEEQDGRGSGAFEQLCDNLIVIDKQVLENKERGLTRLKVLFNREWDRTGYADYLTMDKTTGNLKAIAYQEVEDY